MRAKFEIAVDNFAAIFTTECFFVLLLSKLRPKLMNRLLTAIAHNKRNAFFDSEYRNKKQAEVMVRALVIRLTQAADRASAWILIQYFCFR